MQQVRQKWSSFPAILLTAVLLRAFIPVDYPAPAPGHFLSIVHVDSEGAAEIAVVQTNDSDARIAHSTSLR